MDPWNDGAGHHRRFDVFRYELKPAGPHARAGDRRCDHVRRDDRFGAGLTGLDLTLGPGDSLRLSQSEENRRNRLATVPAAPPVGNG